MPDFTDLIAVLFECFSIISLGYLSARFKLISAEAKDIGAYLSTYALPMIIFLNIAQMEFQTINLPFLFCMLVSKLILFITVTLFTLVIGYPRNYGYAGALSILATQSNDFALGYPLVKSLYGKTRPEMLNYLSLMAPIQLLILNPLGIVMLELEKSRNRQRRLKEEEEEEEDNKRPPREGEFDELRGPSCSSCGPGVQKSGLTRRKTASAKSTKSEPKDTEEKEWPASGRNSFIQANGKIIGCLHPSVIGRKDLGSLLRSTYFKSESFTDFGIIHARRRSFGSAARDCPSTSCSEMSIDSLDCQLVSFAEGDSSGRHRSSSDVAMVGRDNQAMVEAAPSLSPNQPAALDTRPKLLDQCPLGIDIDHPAINSCQCRAPEGPHQSPSSSSHASRRRGAARKSEPMVDFGLLKALATNPLIIASIAALAVNIIHGPQLPKFVTKVSNSIAASFAAPALLVVGLSMYGRFELLSRNPSDLLLSTILVVSKVLILPNLMRTIALIVLPHHASNEEVFYLIDFSFLYGLLPAAPGACIIAKQYDVLGNVVSISMLLSTFLSAPLMLAASFIINQTNNLEASTFDLVSTISLITQTVRVSSVMTLLLSLATIYLLLKIDKRLFGCGGASEALSSARSRLPSFSPRGLSLVSGPSVATRVRAATADLLAAAKQGDTLRVTHLFTFLLAITQLVVGLGGCIWLLIDICLESNLEEGLKPIVHIFGHTTHHGDDENALARVLCAMQYIFSSAGILMARFIIMSMVVTTFAFQMRGIHLANKVIKLMFRVSLMLGVGVVLCLTFEAGHSGCLPTDASLPSWTLSLQLRLIYNITILLLAVPMISATFRSQNKARYVAKELKKTLSKTGGRSTGVLQQRGILGYRSAEVDDDSISAGCHSVRSNPSLNSASTANTNLESIRTSTSTNNLRVKVATSPVEFKRPNELSIPEHSVVLDCGVLTKQSNDEEQAGKSGLFYRSETSNQVHVIAATAKEQPRTDLVAMTIEGGTLAPTCASKADQKFPNSRSVRYQEEEVAKSVEDHHQIETIAQDDQTNPQEDHHQQEKPKPPKEPKTKYKFNRYSILIVFMLIQIVLNITSIIQVLIQNKLYGTLIQVEMTSVAFDFGQGLITFLVISTQKFPRYLISSSAIGQSSIFPNA